MDIASTIAAISTPPGRGGIGIVRLSGNNALRIARSVASFRDPADPRHSYLGKIEDDVGGTVDEAIVTWYSAPRSYTGEDLVEISCHGSPVVLDYCLERAVRFGARLAEPGEFTLRAFYNGRIDLPQAEAVRDLIDSSTLYQAKIAAQQKQGSLSRRLHPIKRELLDLIALMEAGIDFAEDDISVAPVAEIVRRLDLVLDGVRTMADSFAWGRLVREGFSLAIVGAPNVGKSSLFNALLKQDRAIVTPLPGTTRDLVSETVEIDGIPVRLVDTAGIRETHEPIERLGIERSLEAITEATATLLVIDAAAPESAAGQGELNARVQTEGYSLLVANKCDVEGAKIPPGYLAVSALKGTGITQLRASLVNLFSAGTERPQSGFVTNLRQKNLLDRAMRMLLKARQAAGDRTPHEMVLLDIYCALEPLDAITGVTTADDILNRIFSSFCIGK